MDELPATGRENTPSDSSYIRKASIEVTPRISVFASIDDIRNSHADNNLEAPFNADAVTATLGLDWRPVPKWQLGIALSHTRDTQNSPSVDSPALLSASGVATAAKYGGLLALASWEANDRWMVSGYAGWMRGTLDTSREVTIGIPGPAPHQISSAVLFVNASPHTDRLLGGLALDASFPIGRWEWRGAIGFDAMRTSVDAYAEQGISGFELAVPTRIVESVRGRIDVALARTFSTGWCVWQPELRVGLRHEFADDASTIGVRFIEDTSGTLINLDSAAPDRDWAEADFSTVFTFKHGYSAFLRLGREFGHSTSTATFYAIGGRIEL